MLEEPSLIIIEFDPISDNVYGLSVTFKFISLLSFIPHLVGVINGQYAYI